MGVEVRWLLTVSACLETGLMAAECAKMGVLLADCVRKDLTWVPSAGMSTAVGAPAALPGLHECHVDAVSLTVWRLCLSAG